MSQHVQIDDDVRTLWLQIEHDDADDRQALLDRIVYAIDHELNKYKLPGEGTKVTLRMFTKRC